MSDPRDPMGLLEMLQRQEGRASIASRRENSPQLMDRKFAELMGHEDQIGTDRFPRMGELAALDRYGVQPGVVGKPLPNPPPNVERALQLAGPGTPEGDYRSYNRFPDAASEHQRLPPSPPFFGDNTPTWATEQQGTPDFWMEGTKADDPEREYDL